MERETIEVDVVYVGGGPAALSSALYLKRLVREHNEVVEKTGQGKKADDPQIIILEKGATHGAHTLSGAVLDTRVLGELFPKDFFSTDLASQPPFEARVETEGMYFFTEKYKFPILFTPPAMHNKGLQIISLGKFVKWLGELAEREKIEIFTGFAGVMLLEENGKIVGVRTGDVGIDKDGNRKSNFEPGVDIRAKVTILAEGTRGHLTKKLMKDKKLATESNPMCYATGVKEIWELPEGRFPAGKIIHSMGWPLKSYQFGGSFIYGLPQNRIAIGFVVGLDAKDPFTDAHRLFQQFKTHPYIQSILQGGRVERYGAKTIPEGGYWAIPKVYGDGFLILGDSASLVNMIRLKGIHLAIRSGMLAAETILSAMQKEDFSEASLAEYRAKIEASPIKQELWKVRNFRQGYHHNIWKGMFHTAIQMLTGGRGWYARYESQEDFKMMRKKKDFHGPDVVNPPMSYAGDKVTTFDKLTSVYYSGTKHEENQPCHLQVEDKQICAGRCAEEYGNPCQYFCPAHVYEMVDDPENPNRKKLQINFSNCVHCKTCDIMDPYEIITWVAPERGGGPAYNIL